jgi:hypothetical protein
VVVKTELDLQMVQMNVYLSHIDDMLLRSVLLSGVEIAFSMVGEVINIEKQVLRVRVTRSLHSEASCHQQPTNKYMEYILLS